MQELDIEFELDDIAVLHNVGFAFGAEFAGGSYGLLGAEGLEVVVITDLGSDEAAFEIGVDGAGGFGGGGAFFDGPGATFLLTSGEEGLEAESFVGGFDEFAEGVFFDTVGFEKFFAFVPVHAGHFFFEFGIHKDSFGRFHEVF